MALATTFVPAGSGVTTSFQLTTNVSTQLVLYNAARRYVLISNSDTVNQAAIAFNTNPSATITSGNVGGAATAQCHIIPPGGNFEMGPFSNVSGTGPQAGPSCIPFDIAATAVTGNPIIAITEW